MNITPFRWKSDRPQEVQAAVRQSLAEARRGAQNLWRRPLPTPPSGTETTTAARQSQNDANTGAQSPYDRARTLELNFAPGGDDAAVEPAAGAATGQAKRLRERSGFPMARSYENIHELISGKKKRGRKALPATPGRQASDADMEAGQADEKTSDEGEEGGGNEARPSPQRQRPTPLQRNRSDMSMHNQAPAVPPKKPGLHRSTSIKIDTPARDRVPMGPAVPPTGPPAQRLAIETNMGAPTTTASPNSGRRLQRRRSVMVRPNRAPGGGVPGEEAVAGGRTPKMTSVLKTQATDMDVWGKFTRLATCCIPAGLLSRFGDMHEPAVQQAWREKMTLVMIIACMCGALGFLTYGFVTTVCKPANRMSFDTFNASTHDTMPNTFGVHGVVYSLAKLQDIHANYPGFMAGTYQVGAVPGQVSPLTDTGVDITPYFWPGSIAALPPACMEMYLGTTTPACGIARYPAALDHCHDPAVLEAYVAANPGVRGQPIEYRWDTVNSPNSTLMVYRGEVLDMSRYIATSANFTLPIFGNLTNEIISLHLGKDASKAFAGSPARLQMGECLTAMYTVGEIEGKTFGCITSDIVLYVSLIMILGVVLLRFSMAVMFDWLVAWKLGRLQQDHAALTQAAALRRMTLDQGIVPFPMRGKLDMGTGGVSRRASTVMVDVARSNEDISKSNVIGQPTVVRADGAAGSPRGGGSPLDKAKDLVRSVLGRPPAPTVVHPLPVGPTSTPSLNEDQVDVLRCQSPYGLEVYTIMMVAAYSEGAEGIRNTMDSLAETTYSDDHKLIFIVADGLIKGAGNTQSTPEIIIDMLEMDANWPMPPAPMSYVAISEGEKRHNMAQVYVAWYRRGERCIPTILVVKCGKPEESTTPKPGNRGKRDSQIVLMSFLQKVTFDDPMTPLDYDLFQKIHYLMGVTPDVFEIVLMVDADTKVAPDSLPRMVAAMVSDPEVMGLCGETRIANKSETWVSRIQVFEYYLSHHLAKAFESVFGGVTCLPGCFCMYRIKAPKGNGVWVPILCNPDIVDTYSENRVDTLHKKNLLLLGEDRFLTTLMLGTFPHRKQIFVPRAYCKTVVPAEFKVLLSQRRRWINSTIHNLMELVLVRELCGVFCFSMQFVILLELVGTVVLPAAIIFTFLLIIMTFVGPEIPVIPLILLGAILGLPAILILLTTRRRMYIYWMLIYLLALPVWNLVLPSYAFWHFDDFSWGQTRKVAGEAKGGDKTGHGGNAAETDGATEVPRRRWVDWETERRRAMVAEYELDRRDRALGGGRDVEVASNVSGSSTAVNARDGEGGKGGR
ncbi:chitin synthase 4 [Fimicolochytrium jonesii]|uniref:chitin synthase 4 n=1 Tax=Fimicolochytrium jonesii TaxID=1396493 RepID=UPI0022FECAF1|nr:chitin synthase 4 [Fimicolochytrium jonesii]KAI8816033.1 chitin synthase 4 [Fimicolochytrium jonesii]